jgi:hypothetical protein
MASALKLQLLQPVMSCRGGLAPRVFEYLFSEIDKAQDEQVRKGASSNVAAALP